MKFVAKADAQKHVNSSTCTVFEYEMGDADINAAIAIINGRYPEKDFAVNRISKEMIYVISGAGKLTVGEAIHDLAEGDMALIEPDEKYFFEGQDLKVMLPCTPAWTPDQYEEVDTVN